MERYLCIHCHFYQPPRENPWLESVEVQDSAYPYHDWNERITAECYAPNTASRILDGAGRIVKITSNYSRISFDFGPTLLSWMEEKTPDVYAAVIEADLQSRENFSGHGSAMAQAYNHMILPLATRRDKYTQILWGIRDFEHRFGRAPEGMWLPETAVDVETLEILAELGIRFTVLAQSQAKRERRRGRPWRSVEGGKVDPKRPYLCPLPSGRGIAVFFYDGAISQAVAFERLLANGEAFANRLLGGFDDRHWPQLMHIATDGETYGHHHPHGDMALAYALEYMASNQLAKITNYGEYLSKHPPDHLVEIVENTAWSCVHGLGRWASDCGCNTGGRVGWNQQWRSSLRQALDWLRDDLAQPYEQAAGELLYHSGRARDEYIAVVLDRSDASIESFLARHARRELTAEEQVRLLKLLEMQRHLLLMYTSCGWFFDELSGIETVQVLQYAGRAVQLAQELFGDHREQQFLERLAAAHSNLPEYGDGADIYRRFVKPATVNLLGVAGHYAISSLFDGYAERSSIYCYRVTLEDSRPLEAGRTRLALGHAHIRSQITWEENHVSYGVLHFGDHNLSAGVRPFVGEDAYQSMAREAGEAFERADLPQTLRILDRHFGGTAYSLKSLFRDEQRRVASQIVETTLAEVEASHRQLYEHHAPLMRFLEELRVPMPNVLRVTAEFVLNSALRHAFEAPKLHLERVRTLLDVAKREGILLDTASLEFALRRHLEAMAERLREDPSDMQVLESLDEIMALVRSLPFEVNLWKVQNVYYQLMHDFYPKLWEDAERTRAWRKRFQELGEKLGFHVHGLIEAPVAA